MSRKRNDSEAEVQAQEAEAPAADLVWVRNPSGTLDVFVRGSVWHKYALEHGGEETEAPDGG